MALEAHSHSPDGRFRLEVAAWEVRMSHWIECPVLSECAADRLLFAFRDKHWSLLEASWDAQSRLHLALRRYPGDHDPPHLDVVVDCATALATLDDGREIPLARLETELGSMLRKR